MRRLLLCLLLVLATPALASDGVLEINQTCAVETGCFAGDGAGFPVTITAPGSYRLTGNLADRSTASSIVFVSTLGVALDLGGFEIAGDGNTQAGISANTIDVFIRNGTVRDVAGLGIELGSRGRVEGVTIRNAFVGGIDCAADCNFRDLLLSGNGHLPSYTLACGARCEVLDSTLAFNGGAGAIQAGTGSRIEGNEIAGGNPRISGDSSSIVARNTLSGVGSKITVGASSVVESNTISSGTVPIEATGPVIIRSNVIQDSGGTAIAVTGMATIEGNSIDGANGGFGIVCGAGCLVRGNSVRNAFGFGLEAASNPVGYEGNTFTANNGGDANIQVDPDAVDLGSNLCGNPPACP